MYDYHGDMGTLTFIFHTGESGGMTSSARLLLTGFGGDSEELNGRRSELLPWPILPAGTSFAAAVKSAGRGRSRARPHNLLAANRSTAAMDDLRGFSLQISSTVGCGSSSDMVYD
jgi:hypothetical protein